MRTIEELIEEGYEVKDRCLVGDGITLYITGEEYATWLAYCSRYLHANFKLDQQIMEFFEIAKIADGNDIMIFDKLISILKAIAEIPMADIPNSIDDILEKICKNFHRCTKSIANRYSGRGTLEINDEYDVQDLLQGILRMFIDDVRSEDYVPSYAGSNSRTDFYLPEYDTYIETKMTRDTLIDKEVGDQLSVDVARYGDKCKKLICFVYDKNNLLKNPYGLIKDLEGLSSERLEVKVYISPI